MGRWNEQAKKSSLTSMNRQLNNDVAKCKERQEGVLQYSFHGSKNCSRTGKREKAV